MNSALYIEESRRQKIVNVVARMSSHSDGEALNALRMSERMLGRYGIGLDDLVEAALASASPPRPGRVRPRTPAQPMRMHQYTAYQCLSFPHLLCGDDRVFLEDVKHHSELTDADREKLNDIAFRVERGRK